MTSFVSIKAAATSVRCDEGGKAEQQFTVHNTSGAAVTLGARILVEGEAKAEWFTVGNPENRVLDDDASDVFTVRIAVPKESAPAQYRFALEVYAMDAPGESYVSSEPIAVEVGKKDVEPDGNGGFPTWIVALIVGVLVLAGGGIGLYFALKPAKLEIPDVVGQTRGAAEGLLTAAELAVGSVERRKTDEAAPDIVMAQTPAARTKVRKPKEGEERPAVDLVVATAPDILVPAVLTMRVDVATSALAQAGFTPGRVTSQVTDKQAPDTVLSRAGFTVGRVTSQVTDKQAPDTVLTQDPKPGTAAAKGSRVDLVIVEASALYAQEKKLVNASSGYCLDTDGRAVDGGAVRMWHCADHTNQTWEIRTLGSNAFRLINHSSKFCLGTDGRAVDGGAVRMRPCADHADQTWEIRTSGPDALRLINRSSNYCLDTDGRAIDGGAVRMWRAAKGSRVELVIAEARPVPPAPTFAGNWANKDPDTRSITRLEIEQSGNRISVHAWGSCTPRDCDWGVEKGTVSGQTARLVWDQGFVVRTMQLTLQGNEIRERTVNKYNDSRGTTTTGNLFVRRH